MTRPRGRPALGKGVARDDILDAALALLDEGGGKGLTMRALAERLDVTPMSLYNHVADRKGLLVALSDQVYGDVLQGASNQDDQRAAIKALLSRYHDAVASHPHLTLEIFAEPEAFAGVSREITDRLTTLLAAITPEPLLWRNILVDHAHGGGLAFTAARGDQQLGDSMRAQYQQALDCLLSRLVKC